MSELNASYGAPAVSKTRNVSLGKPMLSLLESMPGATDEKLIRTYIKRLRDDPEYVDAALEYTARNMLHNLKSSRKSEPREKRASRLKAADTAAREKVQAIKQALIAQFICPNGKAVRDNPGPYLVRMGGGVARIGKRAGNAIAGEVLTDKEMQKLFAGK